MNINRLRTNSINTTPNKKPVAFTATPEQIISAVKKSNLGPKSKRAHLLNAISKDFIKMRKMMFKADYVPDAFVFKLGEKNYLPPFKMEEKAKSSWAAMEAGLEHTAYERNSSQYPNNVLRVSLGEYARKLLTKLGVEEPEIVTLNKPQKFSILKFFNFSE